MEHFKDTSSAVCEICNSLYPKIGRIRISHKNHKPEVRYPRDLDGEYQKLEERFKICAVAESFLYITKKEIDELTVKLVEGKNTNREAMEKSFQSYIDKKLKDSRIWEFITPIEGILMDDIPIKIGDVQFFQNKSKSEIILKPVFKIYKDNPKYSLEEKEEKKGELNERCNKAFDDKSIAVLKIKGNEKAIREPAFSIIDKALDAFRVFSILFMKSKIHISGYISNNLFDWFCIDSNKRNFIDSSHYEQNPSLFDIRALRDWMKKLGFFRLAEIIGKEEKCLTEIEKSIISSSSWLAQSTLTDHPSFIFLYSIIAMDAILRERNKNRTQSVQNCLPPLISRNKVEKRLIDTNFGKAYERRNEVVHEGDIAIHQNEAFKIQKYAARMISQICANNKTTSLNTQQELLDYCKKKNTQFQSPNSKKII